MSKKLIFIIIGVLLIIAAALCVSMVLNKKTETTSNTVESGELDQPDAVITTDSDGKVYTITIEASIEGDGNSIESIILPDGKIVNKDKATYETDVAGKYDFTINGSNGTSVVKSITVEAKKDKSSSENPYLPEGFTHVEGTEVSTGFVIEDENGNQYVWVPVSSGNLTRNTSGNRQYKEEDTTASGLYNSVAKYYGFYIARFEASENDFEGTDTISSKEGVLPISNINYNDAYNLARKAASVYGYKGVKTALVNSYAWDSALSWLNKTEKNYSNGTSYGNYSGSILNAGATKSDQINMICDMAGNVREWTTEIYYPSDNEIEEEANNEVENGVDENSETNENTVEQNTSKTYRVIRGGSANINKNAGSHIGQLETMTDAYWGFRTILYKD